VTQLSLLDEQLQAELARAPHWAEPRRKVRTSAWPLRVDYRAWLEHAEGCEECGLARDDLVALRSGLLESEPVVPCSPGIRLLPLTDLDAACPGIGRGEHTEAVRRLIDHARELDGWGPEARMSAGQAWSTAP
jgi:hypothetical protein